MTVGSLSCFIKMATVSFRNIEYVFYPDIIRRPKK